MKEWSLAADDALSLRVAADARTSVPSYVDDQIWELHIGGGSPTALSLETSYGLRARGMRIFPGFRLAESTLLDPAEFSVAATVIVILPNYLKLRMAPYADLKVVAEYWVVESNLVAGRFTLFNAGSEAMRPALLLYAQLQPGEDPKPMSSVALQGTMVLTGGTGSLAPVVFLSGGPSAAIAPYPALTVSPNLLPGESETFTWSHAACEEVQDSLALNRELMAREWDAEVARLEQANNRLVEIETGDPEWDLALSLAQTSALLSFVGPTNHLPYPSIVQSRTPNRGFSSHPEGRDHTEGWDGQSAYDVYLTTLQILSAAPELAMGLVHCFLSSQTPDGWVDGNPSLSGQRSGKLCPPLLASLAWRIYQHTEDREFLTSVFPKLSSFVETWFDKAQDADQDGYPEWSTTSQSGFDNWPMFGTRQSWAQALDISLAETPDLASYLCRELRALIEIGKAVEPTDQENGWGARLKTLEDALDRSWSKKAASYLSQDRDLDRSVSGVNLGKGEGDFNLELSRDFKQPVRVVCRIRGEEGKNQALKVSIHGTSERKRNRVERLTTNDYHWFESIASVTSRISFGSIKKIVVRGLDARSKAEFRAADFSKPDHTGLLPLWAGVPTAGRREEQINKAILNPDRYWRAYGIPEWPADAAAYKHARIRMLPNLLIGEGLVDHGYYDEASQLVAKLMAACISTLKQDKAFRESYLPDEPGGSGERNHGSGLAPFSLLLYVLGVRLISPHKVALRGHNPFPWPIRLSHRGIEILWNKDGALVRFPDGSEAPVTGLQVQLVEQSEV